MNMTRIDTLHVPGASLYYEVRGRGPVLLLIGAGAANAASFNGIATHLADRYTVVSYDRRGYARSPLDHPEGEQRIETHSDDAHRLLAILSTEPAYVFGSSGGAKIGLDLAIRHPEQLHTLVAHTNRPRRKPGSLRTERSSSRTKLRCIPATRSTLSRSLLHQRGS